MFTDSPDDRSYRGDRSGSVPVIGEVILVGVAVLVALLVVTLVLDITGVLSEGGPVATVEFTYEGNVSAAYADSFGTTNANGSYDGVLTVTHKHGSAVPASSLFVRNVSSQTGTVSWAASVPSADGPAYSAASEISGSDDLELWVRVDDPVTVLWYEEGENQVTVGVWEHDGG